MALRILYAEDDLSNQKLMELRLRRLGWSVVAVADGESALRHLESDTFELVLMDLHMPGMTGLEACRVAVSRGYTTPMVVLTSDDSLSQELLEAGFRRVLIKPISIEALESLKDLLPRN